MSIAGEQARRGVAITIAYGDAATASQAVFTGTVEDVRRDLAAFFGMDNTSVSELCASDVVVNATQVAHAKASVAEGLGGTVIASGPAEAVEGGTSSRNLVAVTSSTPSAVDAPANPWVAAARDGEARAQTGDAGPHPLLAAIERASGIGELQQIWARNQEAFTVPEVAAAWKTKGRALQSAA